MHRARGFTLVELVVAMAIMAIVVAWAVPTWQDFVLRSRVDSDVRALSHALSMARSEAVSKGVPVSVCPYAITASTPNPTACDSDWQNGWVVYRGATNTITATERLRVHDATEAQAVSGGPARVTFNGRGTLDAGNGTWVFCGDAYTQSLVLAMSGRARRAPGGSCP